VRTVLTSLVLLAGALLFASAAQAAGPYLLEIEASSGSGYGEVLCKVDSGPAGECEWEYESATKLTLVPAPEAESEFVGFKNGTGSASACAGTAPCTFTLKADSYVEAPFELAYRSLAVSLEGEGEGEVSCAVEEGAPEACEDEYLLGTELTLVPEAEAGSEFSGFANGKGSATGCKGTSPCSVVLTADTSLDARFEPIRHLLAIVKTGSGQGAVSCDGTTCAPSYPEGTEITLTATPAQGSAFTGFSGEGCAGTDPCTVWIEAENATVTATFEALGGGEGEAEGPTEPEKRCEVPKLAGKTLRGARSALAASHCVLGRVNRPKPRKGRKLGPLVVRRSLPGAGSAMPAGSKVDLKLGPRKKPAR
jgi:hypothetical protein